MKNLFKKNQLMITALAIMIAIAGYLQFTGDTMSKEDYIATNAEGEVNDQYTLDGLMDLSEEDIMSSDYVEIESMDSDADLPVDNYLAESMEPENAVTDVEASTSGLETPTQGEVPGEAVFTGTSSVAMLSEAKLLKEQVRAKNKATLMEIINSSTLSDEQKQSAVDNMVRMTEIAEKELAAEVLLEAKGFDGVVVSISDSGVDVVVNATELSDAQRAQIEDIVKRKTEVSSENIIISTVVQ